MAIGYAVQNADPETTARALGRDIPVKPKFTVNVCRAIRGMRVAKAKEYLEAVVRMEVAVPFTIHKRHVKHRRGGMGPGAYPVNSAKAVLRVVKDAESNAEYKGLDPENLFVWHTAAHRAAPIRGSMPRAQGRATAWDKSTTHIEIVLKERAESPAAAEPAERAEKKTTKAKPARKDESARTKTTRAKERVAKGTTRKSKKEE